MVEQPSFEEEEEVSYAAGAETVRSVAYLLCFSLF